MNPERHDVRVHEDARADDAAHHDHRGVEQPEPARQLRGGRIRFFHLPSTARIRNALASATLAE